jgi:hypothetical protein
MSANLANAITAVVEAQPRNFLRFHMSFYLLDIMCVSHQYPNMGWKWKPLDEDIHIYCKVLWGKKYKTKYEKICEHFLAPLYDIILNTPTLCMIEKVIIVIKRNEDCNLMDHGTYIMVYDTMKAPHILPRFVPDNLVL